MFGLGLNEILVIALIVLLLFGVKSFKDGMKEIETETKEKTKDE